ncbi:MAG: hypothetical protein R2824_02980 [Saprospiraceae bacterium]
MKNHLSSLLFLLTLSSLAMSQTATFNWNDKDFELGEKRQIELIFAFDGPCTYEK